MNIDKLTKNVNNLSASNDGKNKVCYLVFKATQAVVEIYRKDKVVDSFANYVSDTESVIGIKTYRLKTEEGSSLKVFNFDFKLLPISCGKKQTINREVKNILRDLIFYSKCVSLDSTAVTRLVGHILTCQDLVSGVNAAVVNQFKADVFKLIDELTKHIPE